MHDHAERDATIINGVHHDPFADTETCNQREEARLRARHVILISVCSMLIGNSIELLASLIWQILAAHVRWTW